MLPTSRHHEYLTPESDIQHRIAKCRMDLKKKEISLAWIDHGADRVYFTGSIQSGVLLIPAQGDPVFYAKKSLSRAEAESRITVEPYPGRKGLLNRIRELTGESGRIGLSFEVTPASTYAWLAAKTGLPIDDIGLNIRMQKAVKSDWEIHQIRMAAQQAEAIYHEINNHLRVGRTELEVSGAIEARLRAWGHPGALRIRSVGSELVIITVVAGDSALYPTNFDGPSGGEGPYPSSPAGAGHRAIQSGDTVIVDMVTGYNGYFADHSRIFFMGDEIPETAQQAHAFCLNVLEQIENRLKPGNTCQDIYKEVQAWVESNNMPEGFMGFGENRVKFFGHGVGLELDEFPIIADKIDLPLQPGMVVAVEPKAYLTGIGPVGIENTYVVTQSGCQSLCRTDAQIRRIP